MTPVYIDIAIGRVRVEVNWNAITTFLQETDRDSISELLAINDIKPSDIAPLMAACLNEGARLDGLDSRWTAEEIGCQCALDDISKFLTAYVSQVTPKVKADQSKKKD